VYQHYEARKRSRGFKRWKQWSLAGLFLLSFGFTGGVLFLLAFLVPFERWLTGMDLSQSTIDPIMAALTIGWGVMSVVATAVFWRLSLSQRRNLPLALGALGVTFAASFITFYFLLDTDLMVAVGELSEETLETERLTFGSYPDAQRLEELKDQGYDGVITLLNPNIPFEKVLLQREKENGRAVGIPVHSFPMLPWISENNDSLEGIQALVGGGGNRYYIHCYLGKHRVDLVKRTLGSAGSLSGKREPLPESLERGRLVTYEDERILLGPYPTDAEWLDVVLRRDVKEIVSTLDPQNPQDARWIEKERRIAQDNDLIFTLKPLDASSPEPAAVRRVADYVRSTDHTVYLHDFLDAERLRALDSALRETPSENEGQRR